MLASDDPTAKSWLLQTAIAHVGLFGQRRPADWRQRPADVPGTRYMKKAIELNEVIMVSVSPM